MRNALLYASLRVAAAVLPFLPLSLMYRAARFAGLAAFLLVPHGRRSISENLARVLGASPDSRQVQQAARRAFEHDAMNWVDTLRISRLTPAALEAMIEVSGWESVTQALAAGNGVILVSLHLGNFDLVGQLLAARGIRVTVPVERMQPERLFRFLLEQRRSKGIQILPLDEAPRALVRALRQSELVAVTADRAVAGATIEVTFFGEPCLLPRGPLALIRHSRAEVILGYGVRMADGRFQGCAIGPIPVMRSGNPLSDDQNNVRVLVHEMERVIRLYPDQWLMFSPVWDARDTENGTATIEQQTEATLEK